MLLFRLLPVVIGFLGTTLSPAHALCPNWVNGPPGATARDVDGREVATEYIHYDDLPTVGEDWMVRDDKGNVLHNVSHLKDNPLATQAHFEPQALGNRTLDLAHVSLTAEERDLVERQEAKCGVPPFVCAIMENGMRSDGGPTPVKVYEVGGKPVLMRYYNQFSTHFVGKKGSVVWYPAHGCDEACAVGGGSIYFVADRKLLTGKEGVQTYQYCTLTFSNIYQNVIISEK